MSNNEGSVDAKPSNTPLVEQVRPESWVTQINEIGELQQAVQWYRHSNRDKEMIETVAPSLTEQWEDINNASSTTQNQALESQLFFRLGN